MSKINFGTMSIGNFRNGQPGWGCWKCKKGQRVIHVHDGDVTTYAYAVDSVFTNEEFNAWAESVFDHDKGRDGFSINHLDADEFEIEADEEMENDEQAE